jgi:rod shape-determining protein MreC
VDRRSGSAFARVLLVPAANADTARHVLVLEPLSVQLPERPEPETATPTRRGRSAAVKDLPERAP